MGHAQLDFEGGRSSLSVANRFVACFDVLGFKNLVLTTRLEDLFSHYRHLVQQAVSNNGTILLWDAPGGHLGGGVFTFPCLVFSDTLVLWSEDNEQAAGAFFSSCAHLLKASVETDLPLRGGIAYGESICDVKSGTCLGRALVDAYLTEQSQEWVGAALHESCMARKNWITDVVHYPVPMKPGPTQLEAALLWHHYTTNAEAALTRLMQKAPPSTQHKYQNAITFVQKTPLT